MCDKKNHPLIEVFRTGCEDGIQSVVRWCPDCGAVVVDEELDGRVYAGSVMKMRFPKETPVKRQS